MRVEFFGVSRERVGASSATVDARTLGELVTRLASSYPRLADLIEHDRLHPALAASLNGDRFVRDPHTPLGDDDCVLIGAADVGG
jgi:molybdopterin converting factor small subunit